MLTTQLPVLVGERVLWLGSGSGLPQPAVVKWIGALPEIGTGWVLGVELDSALPYGGIDGTWRNRVLFCCQPKHGLLVPISQITPAPKKRRKRIDLNAVQLSHENEEFEGHENQSVINKSFPLDSSNIRQYSCTPSTIKEKSNCRTEETEHVNVGVAIERCGKPKSCENVVVDKIMSGTCPQSFQNEKSDFQGVAVSEEQLFSKREHFFKRRTSQIFANHAAQPSGARQDRGVNGFFSFFRWFRKERGKYDDFENSSAHSSPTSPRFIRSTSISCGSIDTLFSTTTAHSFAFVQPNSLGAFPVPRKNISPVAETETYRKRISQRESSRELDKNISFKKKYRLYDSDTLYRSSDNLQYNVYRFSNESLNKVYITRNSASKKKRRAPSPPTIRSNDYSLPNTLEHISKISNKEYLDASNNNIVKPHHRRTVSDSFKDKRTHTQCHVKGKRKAPLPPNFNTAFSSETEVENLYKRVYHINNINSFGRKKRLAPQPPVISDTETSNTVSKGRLSSEEKQKLIENIAKIKAHTEENLGGSPITLLKMEHVVCNDSLKLEKGMLKPTKKVSADGMHEMKIGGSPVSPRPWYKRSSTGKSLEKRKERDKQHNREDWMPEIGIARKSVVNAQIENNKMNIFSKVERSEEKRRSQISILTNISELDREAAEIVQKEQAKEQALQAAKDAKFYSFAEDICESDLSSEQPKRSSAKELITLFNAITNVTKVTVNSAFFSKDGPSIFTKEGIEKRFSFLGDTVKTEDKLMTIGDNMNINETNSKVNLNHEIYSESPGVRRRLNNIDDTNYKDGNASALDLPHVTFPESDDYERNILPKTPTLNEANRHHCNYLPSPSIPPITELSEPSSLATTPVSPHLPMTTAFTKFSPAVSSTEQCQPNNHLLFWVCQQCTLENPAFKVTCEACEMWRPTNELHIAEGGATPKPINNLDKESSKTESVSKKGIENFNSFPSTFVFSNNVSFKPIPIEAKDTPEQTQQEFVDNNKFEPNKQLSSISMIDSKLTSAQLTKPSNSEVDIVLESNLNNPITCKANKEKQEQELEEVRRARLAFFRNKSSMWKDNSSSCFEGQDNCKVPKENSKPSSASNLVRSSLPSSDRNIDAEKVKLREILKEMKNSLPKRSQILCGLKEEIASNMASSSIDLIKSESKGNIADNGSKSNEWINHGAIKKVPIRKPAFEMVANQSGKYEKSQIKSNNKAEVYLMRNETVVEDIKVKKQATKVSTSVQTSSLVRKPFDEGHKPPGNVSSCVEVKDVLIPITVEEYTIKDGVLYTSLSKETKRIGTGTFELMRARDFETIEATKTGCQSGGMLTPHLYANIPNRCQCVQQVVDINHHSDAFLDSTEVEQLTAQLTRPKGLAEFKAGLGSNMTTLAVNRLLRRLEAAISSGQHQLAATLARDLARLKVNCSVTRHRPPLNDNIMVEMYIEDKVSHQGPIALSLSPTMTVAQLRLKVEREFEIPVRVQRWILGKTLATNLEATLESYRINMTGAPLFLYLVAPENNGKEAVMPTAPEEPLGELPPLKPQSHAVVTETAKPDPCEDVLPDQQLAIFAPTREENPQLVQDGKKENEIIDQEEEIAETGEEEQHTLEMHHPTGTLALGWRCGACTLVNSPTRPGCAACSAERPPGYHIPPQYEHSKTEVQRINRQQQAEMAAAEDKAACYQELVLLENADLVSSSDPFDCPICLVPFGPADGVILRDCLHTFCRNCLVNTVLYNEEAEVKCPYRDANYACNSALQEREIKALVPADVYERHLAKSVVVAENQIVNAFHCKTADCRGWCIYDDNVNTFNCPVCKRRNCLTCQAIHEGLNCKQYQEQMKQESDTSTDAKRTKEMLEEMVERGEAMNCPTCQVVLMKKWGCDWLRCSMCKTEICWVTRGPRWGPAGKGDTGGGCQCGVNGVKCHPRCNYCH